MTKYSYNDPLNWLKLVDNAVGKLIWNNDLSAESMTSYNRTTIRAGQRWMSPRIKLRLGTEF